MSKFCEIISSKSIMNIIRLLCLVMAICFASGAKAQFYDRADEIYYYAEICEYEEETIPVGIAGIYSEKTGKIKKFEYDGKESIQVWNFDGKKASRLGFYSFSIAKEYINKSSSYYEDLVETSDYDWTYTSESRYIREAKYKHTWLTSYLPVYGTMYENNGFPVIFSSDRNKMFMVCESIRKGDYYILEYKRVDKSFFKVGRSRTPSGTLHE